MEQEIRASALHCASFPVSTKPSQVNEDEFNRTVVEVSAVASRLIFALEASSELRNREAEAAKAKDG